MSENIQAPKKRTYTRKPKCVEPHTTRVGGEPRVDEIPTSEPPVVSDSETSTTSTDSFSLPSEQGGVRGIPAEQVPQKPKRTYKKKVVEPVIDVVDEPPVLVRQTNEPKDEPITSGDNGVSPLKKPRTEKQIEAFNKMREARLKKQSELNHLIELEREEKRIDSEKKKLDAVTERVVEKATEIKKKRQSRRKPAEELIDTYEPQTIPIIQEQKYRNIVFA